jgi:hypothetical protein
MSSSTAHAGASSARAAAARRMSGRSQIPQATLPTSMSRIARLKDDFRNRFIA